MHGRRGPPRTVDQQHGNAIRGHDADEEAGARAHDCVGRHRVESGTALDDDRPVHLAGQRERMRCAGRGEHRLPAAAAAAFVPVEKAVAQARNVAPLLVRQHRARLASTGTCAPSSLWFAP
jgi:hypothetical protein